MNGRHRPEDGGHRAEHHDGRWCGGVAAGRARARVHARVRVEEKAGQRQRQEEEDEAEE